MVRQLIYKGTAQGYGTVAASRELADGALFPRIKQLCRMPGASWASKAEACPVYGRCALEDGIALTLTVKDEDDQRNRSLTHVMYIPKEDVPAFRGRMIDPGCFQSRFIPQAGVVEMPELAAEALFKAPTLGELPGIVREIFPKDGQALASLLWCLQQCCEPAERRGFHGVCVMLPKLDGRLSRQIYIMMELFVRILSRHGISGVGYRTMWTGPENNALYPVFFTAPEHMGNGDQLPRLRYILIDVAAGSVQTPGGVRISPSAGERGLADALLTGEESKVILAVENIRREEKARVEELRRQEEERRRQEEERRRRMEEERRERERQEAEKRRLEEERRERERLERQRQEEERRKQEEERQEAEKRRLEEERRQRQEAEKRRLEEERRERQRQEAEKRKQEEERRKQDRQEAEKRKLEKERQERERQEAEKRRLEEERRERQRQEAEKRKQEEERREAEKRRMEEERREKRQSEVARRGESRFVPTDAPQMARRVSQPRPWQDAWDGILWQLQSGRTDGLAREPVEAIRSLSPRSVNAALDYANGILSSCVGGIMRMQKPDLRRKTEYIHIGLEVADAISPLLFGEEVYDGKDGEQANGWVLRRANMAMEYILMLCGSCGVSIRISPSAQRNVDQIPESVWQQQTEHFDVLLEWRLFYSVYYGYVHEEANRKDFLRCRTDINRKKKKTLIEDLVHMACQFLEPCREAEWENPYFRSAVTACYYAMILSESDGELPREVAAQLYRRRTLRERMRDELDSLMPPRRKPDEPAARRRR